VCEPGQLPGRKTCTFGAVDSATTVALFGDSHAIQWFNPLLGIADKRGWRVVTLLKSGCPAADISVPGKSEAFVRACNGWRARAIRRTLALRPSLVIAASATTYLDGGRADGGEKVSLEEWREGSRRTFSALSSAGIPVAVMRDSPRPSSDVPSCLARSARHSWYPGGGCEFDKAAALRPAAFAAEQAAARSIHNVRFVDLTDALCDQKVCWAEKGGFPVYRDDNHLSGRFAGTLAPILETRIVPFIYPLQ